MTKMFLRAFAFNQPIGDWNTANVTNMSEMFFFAASFNQPIGDWNTANVTNMDAMFLLADDFNQPIGDWNTANVTNMFQMFEGATSFNQPIGDWTLNPAVDLSDMLSNCGMDCDNYSATLIGWSGNPVTPNGRSLGADGRQYGTNAVAARNNLIAKGWTISGDAPSGQNCGAAPPPPANDDCPIATPSPAAFRPPGTTVAPTTMGQLLPVTVFAHGPRRLVHHHGHGRLHYRQPLRWHRLQLPIGRLRRRLRCADHCRLQ
ncbi:MAG: DUF285 domain-containing protein [Saprospiraceae bacterium]|nr:DUF285 domain-containing protein [Saprospiraceae bacterium]